MERIELQRDRTVMGVCTLSLIRILFGYAANPGSNGWDWLIPYCKNAERASSASTTRSEGFTQ